MQHRRCQVTVPCGGDKKLALSQDDEMIFPASQAKVEELLTALRQLEKYVLRLPFRYVMMLEYRLRESYAKIGRMMGMDLNGCLKNG